MKISDLIERYLTSIEAKSKRKTVVSYRRNLNRFLQYLSTQHAETLTDLTPDLITGYMQSLHTFSANTRHSYLSTLRLFLRYLSGQGYMICDYAIHVSIPKPERGKRRQLRTHEGNHTIIKNVSVSEPEKSRNQAILSLYLYENLKRAQIEKLTILDLDIPAGKVRLQTKRKFIDLKPETLQYLKQYLKTRIQFHPHSDYLFLRQGGSKLESISIHYLLRKAAYK